MIKEIMHGLKGADKEKVTGIVDQLKKIKAEIEGVMEEVYNARDSVNDAQKEMGDCFIPVNVQMRRKEITSLQDQLKHIKNEFGDLLQADEDFEGDAATEQ